MILPILISILMTSTEPAELTLGPVEPAADGFVFTEGPVWIPDKGLLFSDIDGNTIYQLTPAQETNTPMTKQVFRNPSGKSNGLTLDNQGRLIACEHWNRRVTRTEPDGTITVLAETYEGKKFNSPNDVVVRSDGMIFFTDPPYGLEDRAAELPYTGVYAIRLEEDKPVEIRLLTKELERPNGLAFSPDEKTLYIADSEAGRVDAFRVGTDGQLDERRTFCNVQLPDGMRVDTQGNLWTTAMDGIHVIAPNGTEIGVISIPQVPANCAFGDADAQTLYVTARTAVYKVRCTIPGIRRP